MYASDKQLKYIRQLVNQAWLSRSDFSDSREYFRKGTMTVFKADELIKLAKKRCVRVFFDTGIMIRQNSEAMISLAKEE